MKYKLLFINLLLFFCSLNFGQNPKKNNSSDIYESIKKLNFLGSVLHVGAHPDDENTNLITYFSNHIHARTAYVSLTRGSGGQNLIGPELRESLGVIRTQELLEARRIDGGLQFFSTARDFGFSKNPDETFKIWDKQRVLSDLTYVIRKFQPDIIINRFDHRTPGTTHGHHTASAILSFEAFNAASDKKQFSEQLKQLTIWQPKRLFFNASSFFYGGSQEGFDIANKTDLLKIDMGSYYPSLGMSNDEISALSRSKHSTQGFGSTGTRGPLVEYFEIIIGNKVEKDFFEGIDTSWNRIKNGKKIGKILSKVEQQFNLKNPSASVADLLKAYALIEQLEDSHWKKIKSDEIKNIIIACTGLFLETISDSQTATAGKPLKFTLEAINRSNIPIYLENISLLQKKYPINIDLKDNKVIKKESEIQISENALSTTPYWLNEKGTLGMYTVSNSNLVGLPETPAPFTIQYNLKINNQDFEIKKPLIYKMNDLKTGEKYKPFSIVPKASVNIQENIIIFNNSIPHCTSVKVKSFINNLDAVVSLKAPKGWKVSPEKQEIKIGEKGAEEVLVFDVKPPQNQTEGKLIPQLKIGNEIFENQVKEVNYTHIPAQDFLLPGEAKIINLNIQKKGNKIGYIKGSGDSIPENLLQIGYNVEVINPKNISPEMLTHYDAVILGIRAFNVVPELKFKNKVLFEYVKNGGNLIVQYNTPANLITNEISPFPLKLSSKRVTNENSDVIFLKPDHPALNYPNKITKKDFEGWVQERGLYFPDQWNAELIPILSMNDKGEAPLEGSLLIAQYGKGNYVYTGLSLFRELPQGVSGAYRLFANLLSLGKK